MMRFSRLAISLLVVATFASAVGSASARAKSSWANTPSLVESLITSPRVLLESHRGAAPASFSTTVTTLEDAQSYVAKRAEIDPGRASWPGLDFSTTRLVTLQFVAPHSGVRFHVESIRATASSTVLKVVESHCSCIALQALFYPYSLVRIPRSAGPLIVRTIVEKEKPDARSSQRRRR